MNNNLKLSTKEIDRLLSILKTRFEQNMNRHKGFEWAAIQYKLEANIEKLSTLNKMEETGGEPDVIDYDIESDEYIFCDCAIESPKGRRSFCYDAEALVSRKENKPKNSAIAVAAEMGIEILTEEQYKKLQQIEKFDTKTSSWLATPSNIRKLGGAIFGDCRYNSVFIYHNGAESYYAARGFRGLLRV
ncbi:MAG: DUF4256 domain-containing protein [Chitinophagaceae bacterium]